MNTGIQVVKEMSSKFSYSGLFASILVCVCMGGWGGGDQEWISHNGDTTDYFTVIKRAGDWTTADRLDYTRQIIIIHTMNHFKTMLYTYVTGMQEWEVKITHATNCPFQFLNLVRNEQAASVILCFLLPPHLLHNRCDK